MGDQYPVVRVAAVQAAPVFLDREATLSKACALIHEAGKNGARVIVFPEGFIPTHPVWFLFHACTSPFSAKMSVALFKNSVEIPGPQVAELGRAAQEANAYVIMGICEKIRNTTGTMFNSQVFLSPDGQYLGKHQKIMPSVGERFVHKGGYGDTLGVFQSEFGPVSALMCSENSNPLAVFALTAEGTRLHAMAWPNFWGKMSRPMREYVRIASENFANVAKAFVISSCSTVDQRMIEMLHLTNEEQEFLHNPETCGGSLIVAPDATVLAGPMSNEEGIIYADLDLEECVKQKLQHDFAGHYNRPDIFQLSINRNSPEIYRPKE